MCSRYLPELLGSRRGDQTVVYERESKVDCSWRHRRAVNWDFITRTNIAVVSWEVGAGGRGCIVLSIRHRGTWTKPLLSLRMTFLLLKNGNPLLPARLPFGLNGSSLAWMNSCRAVFILALIFKLKKSQKHIVVPALKRHRVAGHQTSKDCVVPMSCLGVLGQHQNNWTLRAQMQL